MRPTGRGVATAVAAVVLAATAFAGGYPELGVLAVTLLVALAVAAGSVARPLHLTAARHLDPARVPRGDPCQVTLAVARVPHAGATAAWGSLTLLATDMCGDVPVAVPVIRLRPGVTATAGYAVPTARRGVVRLGPVLVRRRDPFGLVRRDRTYGDADRVLVHPRAYPLHAVPTGLARSLDGHGGKVPQGTITFDRLRPYVRGDELRHVHWRTSARLGELMVREHVEASRPRFVTLLDNRSTGWDTDDSFEEACDAAASLIAAADREDVPLRLRLVVGGAAPPGPTAMLDTLAGAALTAPPDGIARPVLGQWRAGRLAAAPDTSPGDIRTDGVRADGIGTEARPAGDGALGIVAADLRHHGDADTLVLLTGVGPGSTDMLAMAGALTSSFPLVVVAQIGSGADGPTVAGTRHLRAADATGFAAAWDTGDQW